MTGSCLAPESYQVAQEFIDAQACMANYGTKRASVKFGMVRHNQLCKGLVPSKDHVAAFLPFQVEARVLKCLEAFPARNPRRLAHTATTSTSNRSSGTGSPSSARAVMYP